MAKTIVHEIGYFVLANGGNRSAMGPFHRLAVGMIPRQKMSIGGTAV